jgi:His-Xaa-Ser system radical SAM maturase HxsC
MIPLVAKGNPKLVHSTIVGIFERADVGIGMGLVRSDRNASANTTALLSERTIDKLHSSIPAIENVNSLDHLNDGDIVVLTPTGVINTLFRVNSQHNALFVTDRCNSNCLMCSQPPRNVDDLDYHFEINQSIINLLPKGTEVIGITGGEPTLLGDRLVDLVKALGTRAPNTMVHMLSNGRAFAWTPFTKKFSGINENLVIGIPLYADNFFEHDYIVQAKDAFNQTVQGLHKLARFELRVEIRVVLHKLSCKRLPHLARFIYMNFPFVEHVALMGLEYVGYTPFNHDKLWIEPTEYMDQLEEATLFLDDMGIAVSIYNLQHCLLRPTLWRFSRKSISDWKNQFLSECANCKMIDECGGIFATSKKTSLHIKAITD